MRVESKPEKLISGRLGHWYSFEAMNDYFHYALLQDRHGRLWVGTAGGGLGCYDGDSWEVFFTEEGLPDSGYRALLEDRQGRVWVGAGRRGLSCYDGSRWQEFTAADGLPGIGIVTLLEDRQGRLWVGTFRNGLGSYDGTCWQKFTAADGLPGDEITALLEDRQGRLWVGTFRDGLGCYRGDQWQKFTAADGLPGDEISALLEDRQGRMWVGTFRDGLGCYRGDQWQKFTAADGLPSNEITTLLEDRQGQLWVGTAGSGLGCYNGSDWTAFAPGERPGHRHVYALLQGHEGLVWAGTQGGLCQFDPSWTTYFICGSQREDQITAVLVDRRGQVWVGHAQNGVSLYDGHHWTHFNRQDGLLGDTVQSICEDRHGHIWVGGKGGVSRYDGQSFANYTFEHGLAKRDVAAVFVDRQDHLWFAMSSPGEGGEIEYQGASRYDGQSFTVFTTDNGVAHNQVQMIRQDQKGHIWFATAGGVSRFDGKCFTTFTTDNGLPHNFIEAILPDQNGRIWCATQEGISYFDGQLWQPFSPPGLPKTNHGFSIFQDRQGHLWFGTAFGVMWRYDGQVVQYLNQKDGIFSGAVSSIGEDDQGQMWFGGSDRMTCFRPPSSVRLSVAIDAVVADRRYPGTAPISITGVGLVAFEFSSISLTTQPGRMVYRYRLGGYEDDWKTTRQRRVEYANLPIGDYTFSIQAVDRELNYSDMTQIKVQVEPDARMVSISEALIQGGAGSEFIGTSPALRKVQQQVHQVAHNDLNVLILGETGTGKGLAARSLHSWSERAKELFLIVNCGAIPDQLVESELFGHEKGAFTGAVARRLGKVELAQGGTLFLDEIGDLPLDAQVKLLRLLEEREYERVGGTQTLKADVRIVAATNRDLLQMVEEQRFRSDLYFRLAVFPIQLPPLRNRQEDIQLLALHFLERQAAHLDKPITRLSSEALAWLRGHPWPGNVRELEHVIQRAVVVSSGPILQVEDLVLHDTPASGEAVMSTLTPKEYERQYIEKVLEQTEWVIAGPKGAASVLEMSEATLRYRIKKLGLQKRS